MECLPYDKAIARLVALVTSRGGSWEDAAAAVEKLVRDLEYTGYGVRAELDAVDLVVCLEDTGGSTVGGRPPARLPV